MLNWIKRLWRRLIGRDVQHVELQQNAGFVQSVSISQPLPIGCMYRISRNEELRIPQ